MNVLVDDMSTDELCSLLIKIMCILDDTERKIAFDIIKKFAE